VINMFRFPYWGSMTPVLMRLSFAFEELIVAVAPAIFLAGAPVVALEKVSKDAKLNFVPITIRAF